MLREPYPHAGLLIPGTTSVPQSRPGAESNQDEIDERDQGRGDAGDDQGIIGADVAPGTER